MEMENFENIRLPWTDWKIVKNLGSGTYGRVYEIKRNISGVQEKAALKIVSRPKDANEVEAYYSSGYDKASIAESYQQEIQNYVQEYMIMKELQGQSNIVSCDDFTVVPHEDGIGGDIFIRMELLTSLQQVLKERMLSVEEIIKLGKDISHALILCENKNIVHRDIKPANIMVSQFTDYKLGDFGVSKIMDHATYATPMGTPEYQAPEVEHMERYGHRADIYSLGVTLYWLLNNRRMPFVDANKKLDPMVNEAAKRKRYAGNKLPAPKNGSDELKKIVLKACEYEPGKRYASAQEMYDALDALGNEKPTVDPIPVTKHENTDDSGTGSVTVGRNGVSGSESDRNGGGQTQGNSWVENGGTIGKPGGPNGQNKDKDKGYSEVPDPGTVGVKDAYKKQKKKAEEKKEATVQTYQKRVKKTVFGYLWEIFILGFCVVFLLRTIQIGTFKENPILMLVIVAGIAIPEALELITKSTFDMWKFCVDGLALSSIYVVVVYNLADKKLPMEFPGDAIFGILGFVVFYFGGKFIDNFTYVLVNEPVEKSDNKSKTFTDSVKDEDLHKTVPIKESEIGKTIKLLVNYPDGEKRKLVVHIPENVSDGTILRIKGFGKTKDGNLLLHLEIGKSGENMPTTVGKKKKSFFGKVKDLFK